MLQVDSISVIKNNICLLTDIQFELQAGGILSVVGPNGAGKTTLVKALVGDVELHSGAILFDRAHLNSWQPKARSKHIAVLPQSSTLNFPYSVGQVVALGRTPHSTGSTIDERIVSEAMKALDISHLQYRTYTELSGGEKQRTQLARVMTQIWRDEDATPRLLILDEPTSALDLGHKQQLMDAITEFARGGVAVLIVEHDLNIALRYSSSILALNKGRVAAFGEPNAAITERMIAEVFNARANLLINANSGRSVIGF